MGSRASTELGTRPWGSPEAPHSDLRYRSSALSTTREMVPPSRRARSRTFRNSLWGIRNVVRASVGRPRSPGVRMASVLRRWACRRAMAMSSASRGTTGLAGRRPAPVRLLCFPGRCLATLSSPAAGLPQEPGGGPEEPGDAKTADEEKRPEFPQAPHPPAHRVPRHGPLFALDARTTGQLLDGRRVAAEELAHAPGFLSLRKVAPLFQTQSCEFRERCGEEEVPGLHQSILDDVPGHVTNLRNDAKRVHEVFRVVAPYQATQILPVRRLGGAAGQQPHRQHADHQGLQTSCLHACLLSMARAPAAGRDSGTAPRRGARPRPPGSRGRHPIVRGQHRATPAPGLPRRLWRPRTRRPLRVSRQIVGHRRAHILSVVRMWVTIDTLAATSARGAVAEGSIRPLNTERPIVASQPRSTVESTPSPINTILRRSVIPGARTGHTASG